MKPNQKRALIALVYFVGVLACCGALSRVIAAVGVVDVLAESPGPASIEDVPYLQCVPESAVYRDGAMTYVFVVDERSGFLGMELCARRVNVGVTDSGSDYVALREGALADSQRVIVEASRMVSDGDAVRVVASLRKDYELVSTGEEGGTVGVLPIARAVMLLAPAAAAAFVGYKAFMLRRKPRGCRLLSAMLPHASALLLLLALTAAIGQCIVLYGDFLPNRWSSFAAWEGVWELLASDGGAAFLADSRELPGYPAAEHVSAVAWAISSVVIIVGVFATAGCRYARKGKSDEV